ncbi:sigma-E factor regulatory protein RseB [Vibrio sp. FNV 38]|nr:sigma-E factor regulatory protein RseB [Vibrio sp. FNV 38]
MKKILISALTLFGLTTHTASAAQPAEALLQEMHQASEQLSYELSYILIKKNSIEPLLYRHARFENQQLAHLLYLSGPVREVIRRDDEVSYVEPGIEPFTVESNDMVAPTIPLLHNNIEQLSQNYDFVSVGRAREAGSAAQVVRIVPKDGLRYSYVLWVEESSHLPLRADLVDRDGEILEQYRTISFVVNEQISEVMAGLKEVTLPEVLTLPKGNVNQASWNVGWVPNGFKAADINRYRMAITNRVVESQMYSDGLFNFSVYIGERDENSLQGQVIRQGRRTLHTFIKGDAEISIVGDIPPSTAQRIAQSVTIEPIKAIE